MADTRSAEEDQAKQMIAGIESMIASSLDFMAAFEELRSAVLRHAELEEREEFPVLVRAKDIDDLQRMATRVNVAEAVASARSFPVGGDDDWLHRHLRDGHERGHRHDPQHAPLMPTGSGAPVPGTGTPPRHGPATTPAASAASR